MSKSCICFAKYHERRRSCTDYNYCEQEAIRCGAEPLTGEKQLAADPSRGVLNERGSTHGDFKENGAIMQALKDAMRQHFGWSKLEPYEREALEMIQHKVGRILCGNHKFFDHWRDIAGYAKLVEERCPKP